MREVTAKDYQVIDTQLGAAVTEVQYKIFSMLKPSIQIDGNQWCVLYGEDLQSGVAGFGDIPHLAVLDFNTNWHKSLNQKP
jgi:hypothetical protein